MPVLTLQALTVHGVGPVDLTVGPGEVAGLIGPSGAGKTLLLRAVADLVPHGGEALLDGVPATAMPAHRWRAQVGWLPAESPWWHDTVGEHFVPCPGVDFTVLGLPAAAGAWQVSRLSTGEKQRLALLRLLCRGPAALLLDEPTSGLDATATRRVEHHVREYLSARQAPVIWVSHDQEQLARVADAIYILEGGALAPMPRPGQGNAREGTYRP